LEKKYQYLIKYVLNSNTSSKRYLVLVRKYLICLTTVIISRNSEMENIWGDGSTGTPDSRASICPLGMNASTVAPTGEEDDEDNNATGVDEDCLDKEDSMDMSGDEENTKDSSVDLTVPLMGENPKNSLSGRGGGQPLQNECQRECKNQFNRLPFRL
jgi:hypothetical protein